MGILSFQGQFGSITWPFRGPVSLDWWKSLFDANIPGSHADEIRASGRGLALGESRRRRDRQRLAFTLSMAFRRKFRGEGLAFYLHHARADDAGLPARARERSSSGRGSGTAPSLWKTALGANVIWGIPFGFLVMLAVWNRYDERIEEAARDLGADQKRTFREVTLPLVWTGHLRLLPLRLHADVERLRPLDPARQRIRDPDVAADDRRPDVHRRDPPRPLRARHRDDARLAVRDRAAARRRGGAPALRRAAAGAQGRGGARRGGGPRTWPRRAPPRTRS